MKEKLLKIINNYGVNHQLKHLYTEMYEFTEAVFEYEYAGWDFNDEECEHIVKKYYDHIQEEFADLMVMLEQFKAYYNLSNEDIMKTMEYKIERQLKRIEEEKNGTNNNI